MKKLKPLLLSGADGEQGGCFVVRNSKIQGEKH